VILAAPELAAIAALFACVFLIMLYYAYGYSIGALMQLLARMFRSISIHVAWVGNIGLGFVGDAIDGLDNDIRHAIGYGIRQTESGFHYMLHWSAYTFERIGAIIEELTGHTFRSLVHLRHVVIPALIHAAVRPIWHRLGWIENQLLHRLGELGGTVAIPWQAIKAEVDRLARMAVAVPIPRIGNLERDLAALRERLRSIERGGVVAALGVVAGVMLAKLGLGWTRCSNVGKVGKTLCGLDRGLLDALLLGTTLIVSTISLVEWAELMLEVEDELVAGITGGFRELHNVTAG
jgi:hypothetical protein